MNKFGVLTILLIVVINTQLFSQVLVNPGDAACLGRYTTTFPGIAARQPFNTDWELPGSTDIVDKTQQTPKVVAGFTQPIQTNDWWSSAIWDYYQGEYNRSFTGNMFALPWTGRAIRGGLQLQYKNLATNTNNADNYIFQSATNEISVSLAKGATNMDVPGGAGQGTQVKNYGDYHVTLTWNDPANTMSMDATLVKGGPFVFFDNISASTDVIIRTACGPMNNEFTSPSGNRRITICGRNYGIFFSPGSVIVSNPVGGTMWTLNEGGSAGENVGREYLRFTPPATLGQRYVILAALPNNTNATFLEYERRAYAFTTNTQATFAYNEGTADVTTTFVSSSTLKANAPAAIAPLNESVHAIFRHQFLNIDPSTPINTSYQYESPRGNMQVRYGNFNTIMKHYGMLQHLPWYGSYRGADSIAMRNLINQKYLQTPALTGLVQPSDDLYFWAKRLGEIAQLMPIARMVNHMPAYNRFRDELRLFLADLLTTTAAEVNAVAPAQAKTFYYDANWDMLVHYPGSFWSTDQGNDRHFHYGYVIQASAMLARYDPSFITQYGPMVEMLIKDVANWERQIGGTDNNVFPYLRYFDAYEGHSWANGMADGLAGNDQESSSESINLASSIALWGEVTGNNTLRDLGIYLRTTEIAATEQYWWDVDNVVYPAGYGRQTSGMIYGGSANYQIFFGGNMRQGIYGINWFPFTGSSYYLSMPQPAGYNPANKFAEMLANQIAPATVGNIYYHEQHFPDMMISYRSFFNPATAITEFNNLGASMDPISPSCCPYGLNGQNHPYDYYDGQYTAFTHHWIHTNDSLRNVQKIYSNNSKTHVFFNTCWHYVIDNDQSTSINVTFSDGRIINNIPRDTVIVYRFCNPPLPVELVNFNATLENNQSLIKWSTVTEKNSDFFELEKSCDGVHFTFLDKIISKENSNDLTNYSFIDTKPCSGATYYRLKMVDKDGTFVYSKVINVNQNSVSLISIQPNPTSSQVTISIQSDEDNESIFTMYDVLGKVLFKREVNLSIGLQDINFDLSHLSNGTYIMSVNNNFRQDFYKIIKQ
jgi:endoglucanase Acf2